MLIVSLDSDTNADTSNHKIDEIHQVYYTHGHPSFLLVRRVLHKRPPAYGGPTAYRFMAAPVSVCYRDFFSISCFFTISNIIFCCISIQKLGDLLEDASEVSYVGKDASCFEGMVCIGDLAESDFALFCF